MFALLIVTTTCHFLIALEIIQIRMNINLKSLTIPNQNIGCENGAKIWHELHAFFYLIS